MFTKIWNWLKGETPETPAIPDTPPPTEASTGKVIVTYSSDATTPTTTWAADGGAGAQGTVKVKRKYTKKKVANAAVFVADDVEGDLTAKGVDVDKAVETTLKKTSTPKVKKSPKKLTKNTNAQVAKSSVSVYNAEDWERNFLDKKGK